MSISIKCGRADCHGQVARFDDAVSRFEVYHALPKAHRLKKETTEQWAIARIGPNDRCYCGDCDIGYPAAAAVAEARRAMRKGVASRRMSADTAIVEPN